MKKLKKLTAAVAVALGLGFAAPNASAIIEVESGGTGDALLFPLYIGKSGWENYYSITNNSGDWVQGHLRFRGAAWSAEMRDFDVILSPGDVFVFRVADIDGDGVGELDMSLDPYNFMYTGMLEANNQWFDPADGSQLRAYGDLTQAESLLTSRCRVGKSGDYLTSSDFVGRQYYPCMDLDAESLVDSAITAYYPGGIAAFDTNNPGKREHQKTVGYIEFIGEGVLEGMSHSLMASLLGSDAPANANVSYPATRPRLHDGVTEHRNVNIDAHQTDVFSGRGTNLWQWTNAENAFVTDVDFDGNRIIDLSENTNLFDDDLGARDVPNVLTGTGFVSITGGAALAFNAEALINFRTANNEHRIDNYRVIQTSETNPVVLVDGTDYNPEFDAVIIHNEFNNASPAGLRPFGDYIYGANDTAEEDLGEASISFNNSWGPTMADGDDYDLTGFRVMTGDLDDFDSTPNSIAEVEEAIRLAGQTFYGNYFDGGSEGSGVLNPRGSANLTQSSWYFSWYPTKFYYGETPNVGFDFAEDYDDVVEGLMGYSKGYGVEVWDINENPGVAVSVAASACPSPFIPSLYADLYPQCVGKDAPAQVLALTEELSVFNITNLKNTYGLSSSSSIYGEQYTAGRVVLSAIDNNPMDDGVLIRPYFITRPASFPGLMYGFEFENDSSNLYHWRPMQRSGSHEAIRDYQ